MEDVAPSLAHRVPISASVVVFVVVAALHAVQGDGAFLQANAVARFFGEPSERSW